MDGLKVTYGSACAGVLGGALGLGVCVHCGHCCCCYCFEWVVMRVGVAVDVRWFGCWIGLDLMS